MAVAQKRGKHVPERTCIVCRQKRRKWELIRIVRNQAGDVEIDLRGKKAGRGAYLCRVRDCWQIGLRKKKIGHALKIEIAPEQYAELEEFGAKLPLSIEDSEHCFRE
ncbi:MAG: YlxR family protein [Dehalococcoidia bacterium]|nr:YlxR family protein [Dehalococcoidia bacterium]